MPNIGKHHFFATKEKMSLAHTKDRTDLENKIEEYISALVSDAFPSLTSAALHAGISEKNLNMIEFRSDENSKIRGLLEHIRDLQKQFILDKGIIGKTDSRYGVLFLKALHGLREEPNSLTQNNTFNISPEILADAIAINKAKNKKIKEVNVEE